MHICLLKSKLHRARVTDRSLHYEGSLTVSADLMQAAGFLPYEKILVGNMANGKRFETYLIAGPKGAGQICLNGATAHLGKKGDRLTIMSFTLVDARRAARHKPRIVRVDGKNRPVR